MKFLIPAIFQYRQRFRLFALLMPLCIHGAAQPFETGSPGTMEHIKKGERLFTELKFDSAIAVFKNVLTPGKSNEQAQLIAYDRLADIMLANGRFADTRRYDSLLLPKALKRKDTSLIINVYNRMGIVDMEYGHMKEAEKKFATILQMGGSNGSTRKTAEIYSNIGSNNLAAGNKNDAAAFFFKALRLYETIDDKKGIGETFSNISSVYYLTGNTKDAIAYQLKSIKVREESNDLPGLVITHTNIGQLYILADSSNLALAYLTKAVKYAEQLNNAKLMGAAYSGLSAFYYRNKKFADALQWQDKAIRYFEETDNKTLLSRLYVSAGNIANSMNDTAAAARYYKQGLALSIALQNKENIANAHEKLSAFYLSRKNPEQALLHYKQFIVVRDSIAATSALNKIEEIRAKYETEKKDNEIAKLYTAQRIKELQIEKQNALIAGNKAAAVQKQKEIDLLEKEQALRNLKLQQQEEELERNQLLVKNNEQQLLLAKQQQQFADKELTIQKELVSTQKQLRNIAMAAAGLVAVLAFILFNRYQLKKKIEQQTALLAIRNDIAKNLHDDIGSTLTSIKILSEVSKTNLQKDRQKAAQLIDKITEQSEAMQQGMSDIVWAITPDNDKLENMLVRMREYVSHTLEPKEIKTVFNVQKGALSRNIGMQQRKDFFLVFKEAVNNAAKHAHASEVIIDLWEQNNVICMKITDNGRGFDTQKITSSNGLKNIKARAGLLNGRCSVFSQQGKGTVIAIEVPAT